MTCFKKCNDHIDVFLKINPRKIGFWVNWLHPSTKESLIGEESVAMTTFRACPEPAPPQFIPRSFPSIHFQVALHLR